MSTMGSVFSSLRECVWLPNYGTAPSPQRTAPPSMPRFGFDGRSPTSWKVHLCFASNDGTIKKETLGNGGSDWYATLDITTTDIVGLMREGLYVSQGDVKVQDNHLRGVEDPKDKTKCFYFRHYTLVNPRWSGQLTIKAWKPENASEFRLDHLSADGVYKAYATDATRCGHIVYWYEVRNPFRHKMNLVLDDEPLPGLWPWPKKEPGGQEEKDCDWEKVQ